MTITRVTTETKLERDDEEEWNRGLSIESVKTT